MWCKLHASSDFIRQYQFHLLEKGICILSVDIKQHTCSLGVAAFHSLDIHFNGSLNTRFPLPGALPWIIILSFKQTYHLLYRFSTIHFIQTEPFFVCLYTMIIICYQQTCTRSTPEESVGSALVYTQL